MNPSCRCADFGDFCPFLSWPPPLFLGGLGLGGLAPLETARNYGIQSSVLAVFVCQSYLLASREFFCYFLAVFYNIRVGNEKTISPRFTR
jgi:hypothetical protein